MDATTSVLDIDTTNARVGIGTATPANTLDVAETVKLGTAGTAFTSMGVCTVASYTPTITVATKTCTGVPASVSVAVNCSASGAFSTTTGDGYARANGNADTIEVNTIAANTNAVTLTCMWVKP